MKNILGIGNALVDVMTVINDDNILDTFNLPKGSMQLVNAGTSLSIKTDTASLISKLASGGSAANTIHGLAMLGVKTGFIGSIGKDEMGDFFENDMKFAGISSMLLRRNTVTGTAVALISPDSERTFATHLGAAVELDAVDMNAGYFEGYHILYLEGYLILNKPLVEKACRLAKERNMKIAFDLASYNVVEAKLVDLRDIVNKYVDILFANEDEARAFTGKDPVEALYELSELCEIAIVKAGSEGSWIKRGEEIIRINAAPADLKDTTGAGDLYASGFLYGYAMDQNLEICGQFGSILAGHVIEIVGARMDQEKWEVIRKAVSEKKSELPA
jgi:sugar/nucleoside kinase (ribokinase family)